MEKQFTIPPLRPATTMKKAPEPGPFGVVDTMRYIKSSKSQMQS